MFDLFKGNRKDLTIAQALYDAAVSQARRPVFYSYYGAPDSLDGRFEMICLHVYLLMNRLFDEGWPGEKLAQALFDVMFRDMDRSLREMGVGDLSLPRHVKRMMKGFNGRATAYQQAMQSGEPEELIAALRRNLYGTVDEPRLEDMQIIALYMHETALTLQQQSWEALALGQVQFKDFEDEEQSHEEREFVTGMVA